MTTDDSPAETRRDAGLALLTLAVFVSAFVLVDASVSVPAVLVGTAGTVAFEVVTLRRAETVRSVWTRPAVQIATFGGAVAIAVGGAIVAPAIVLSAGIGTLVAYLLVLTIVFVRR